MCACPKTPADSPAHLLITSQLMTPTLTNFGGNVHGGAILKILDEVAFSCASRYASRYVVTRFVHQVLFRAPLHVGQLATFLAAINHTGNSSMEVGIRVIGTELTTGQETHAISAYFTMVAVKDGKPVPVPPFVPSTDDERRRHKRALIRKAHALSLTQDS